jgi:predicted XRE-type DNA-binding protein
MEREINENSLRCQYETFNISYAVDMHVSLMKAAIPRRAAGTVQKQMRGPLHERLIALLKQCITRGDCTQESVARAAGVHQTTVSGVLQRNAGTFDLDAADAVLRHVGSSLAEFAANIPPRDVTADDQMIQRLNDRPPLKELVAELLDVVPKTKAADVVRLARAVLLPAIAKRSPRTGGSRTGLAQVARTRLGSRKRR